MLTSGKIITFYSYKGGTGRTMAAANMAWVMASNGCKVLLIDWDLESPGLHRYLRPFMADPDLVKTDGLIDFLWDVVGGESAGRSKGNPSLMDYGVRLDWKSFERGSIDFIGAGRQDENYRSRVNKFDWKNFFGRYGGDRLLESARDDLKKNYDYVIIDSRAGVSDTAGVCTVQMPDMLVVPFTLNHQSIEGAAATVAAIQSSRRVVLPIFPVPTRVEYDEQAKLSTALAFARRTFAPFLLHIQSDRRTVDLVRQIAYWQEVETPYVAYYAFEEIPAVFKDEPRSRRGVLAATERLSGWITDGEIVSSKFGDENRSAILEAFAFDRKSQVRLDWTPAGRSSLPVPLQRFVQWLVRYRWQAATMVLATALIATQAEKIYRTWFQATPTSCDSCKQKQGEAPNRKPSQPPPQDIADPPTRQRQ